MRHTLIIVLAAAWAGGQAPTGQARAAGIEMGEPMTAEHAGVTIAMPKGFRVVMTDDPSNILRAVREEMGKRVVAVTLSALPLKKGLTLEQFIKAVDPGKSLAVRRMKVLTSMPVKVGGVDGQAQVQSYAYRGVETTAVRLYFVRPIPNVELQAGYMLTVEADKQHGKQTLPVLGAVAETVKLTDPVSPATRKVVVLGAPVTSKSKGYTFRPPMWWTVKRNAEGTQINVSQTDYLRGAVMPQGSLVVTAETRTPETCAKEELNRHTDNLHKDKQVYKVLRAGKAKMCGLDGYEYVIRHRPGHLPEDQALMFAQRTACANGLRYSMILVYQGTEETVLTEAMNAIVGGMEIFKPQAPATAPAAKAGSAPSQSSATAPAAGAEAKE